MSDVKKLIHWMWEDADACGGKPVCLAYVVKAHDPVLLRGTLTGKQCVEAAIVSSKELGLDTAARWLMAGQAHSPEAQAHIWENKKAAVDFAIKTYGPVKGKTIKDYTLSPKQIWEDLARMTHSPKKEPSWNDIMVVENKKAS